MDDKKKTISPLRRMLMDSTSEALLNYLHDMKVQFVLSRKAKGGYEMTIYKEGMVKYKSSSGGSPKSVIADTVALFLAGERRDFHDYL